ncbi:hypothetical protein LNTAR_16853 [Lentisphaera araneosa HTCC2155]|uniref:Type II secretion system protein n=1 Tax=Lentisphaera araneosa HTCC2155 TaxID=313628 RepID=A6DF59_9BACT|nr:type II secretion system protein [Lentisphaera araneosa]EDM29439.1 hypothetical protein LNTAR_16853 [Lentisphaera araneosa HTCC2155]
MIMIKKRASFSLIEILVVVAIIGILSSLLLPVLSKTRKKAKTVLCKNNLKTMHLASALYADDNDEYFTPYVTGINVTWDDLYSDYDGRNLSQDQREKVRLQSTVSADVKKTNELYKCPSDSIERDSRFFTRSYVINRSIGGGGTSISRSDLTQATITPFHTTKIRVYNRLGEGNNSYADAFGDVILQSADNTSTLYPGLHGTWSFNYLFCDGHVETRVYSAFDVSDWDPTH